MKAKGLVKTLMTCLAVLVLLGMFAWAVRGVALAADMWPGTVGSNDAYFFDKRNKVLIHGTLPGQIITVYGVDGSETPIFDTQGRPSGQHAGDYLAPTDGKLLEIYIPLSPVVEGPHARVSRLFLWSPNDGWTLIASLAPLESFPDTHVWVR